MSSSLLSALRRTRISINFGADWGLRQGVAISFGQLSWFTNSIYSVNSATAMACLIRHLHTYTAKAHSIGVEHKNERVDSRPFLTEGTVGRYIWNWISALQLLVKNIPRRFPKKRPTQRKNHVGRGAKCAFVQPFVEHFIQRTYMISLICTCFVTVFLIHFPTYDDYPSIFL